MHPTEGAQGPWREHSALLSCLETIGESDLVMEVMHPFFTAGSAATFDDSRH